MTPLDSADAATLSQLAVDPVLRPAIALAPAAYPELLRWLGSLGEPATDAALQLRDSGLKGDMDPSDLGKLGVADPALRAAVALHPNAPADLLVWFGQLRDEELDAALAQRDILIPALAAAASAVESSAARAEPPQIIDGEPTELPEPGLEDSTDTGGDAGGGAAGNVPLPEDADPRTLYDLGVSQPELRAAVARHPNAPEDLLVWFAQLGDPALDEALAHRKDLAASTQDSSQRPDQGSSQASPEDQHPDERDQHPGAQPGEQPHDEGNQQPAAQLQGQPDEDGGDIGQQEHQPETADTDGERKKGIAPAAVAGGALSGGAGLVLGVTTGSAPDTPEGDPAEGIEASDPAEGIKPSEPTEAVNPSEPTEAVNPSEPTEAVNPSEPTEAVRSSAGTAPEHGSEPAPHAGEHPLPEEPATEPLTATPSATPDAPAATIPGPAPLLGKASAGAAAGAGGLSTAAKVGLGTLGALALGTGGYFAGTALTADSGEVTPTAAASPSVEASAEASAEPTPEPSASPTASPEPTASPAVVVDPTSPLWTLVAAEVTPHLYDTDEALGFAVPAAGGYYVEALSDRPSSVGDALLISSLSGPYASDWFSNVILAVEPETGDVRWSYPLAQSGDCAGADEVVLCVTTATEADQDGGYLIVLDAATGTELRMTELGYQTESVDWFDGGAVVTGGQWLDEVWHPVAVRYDTDGSEVWRVSGESGVASVIGDRVQVTPKDAPLEKRQFDPVSGEELDAIELDTGDTVAVTGEWGATWVAYQPTQDLAGFTLLDGTYTEVPATGPPMPSAALVDGVPHLVFVDSQEVSLVSLEDGDVRTTGLPETSGPTYLVGTTLVLLDEDLHGATAFNLVTGAVEWEHTYDGTLFPVGTGFLEVAPPQEDWASLSPRVSYYELGASE